MHPIDHTRSTSPSSLKSNAADAKAERIGRLSEREFLILGLALYAGEGGKTPGDGLRFANSDPRMIATFLAWLRHFYEIDERRLRLKLYLHADLTLMPRSRSGWV